MAAAALVTILMFLHAATRTHAEPSPVVKCSIHVVGYTFQGVEGQRLELAGVTYTVGKNGVVEVISDGDETFYRYEGKALPLTVWPANEFSFVQVPLPRPEAGGPK